MVELYFLYASIKCAFVSLIFDGGHFGVLTHWVDFVNVVGYFNAFHMLMHFKCCWLFIYFVWIYAAEELKLPYLSAYLNSVGSNYRHGANFATGGSSIRPGGYSPFHLGLQVSQFIQFKSHTKILFNQLSDNSWFSHPYSIFFSCLCHYVRFLEAYNNNNNKIEVRV